MDLKEKQFFETNSTVVLPCTVTDASFMEFPCSFHVVSMHVSCWYMLVVVI